MKNCGKIADLNPPPPRMCACAAPSPPSALCTVFGEQGLPCPITSLCLSLSPCPVSSPPSPFFLPSGALGGGGVCCCREGVEEGAREGEWDLAPSFPLKREILTHGGSLLVSVCLVWVVLATCFCWPHILVCPGCSCMLFDGRMALGGAAVVDHARSARRQSKGSGTGLVPLHKPPPRK